MSCGEYLFAILNANQPAKLYKTSTCDTAHPVPQEPRVPWKRFWAPMPSHVVSCGKDPKRHAWKMRAIGVPFWAIQHWTPKKMQKGTPCHRGGISSGKCAACLCRDSPTSASPSRQGVSGTSFCKRKSKITNRDYSISPGGIIKKFHNSQPMNGSKDIAFLNATTGPHHWNCAKSCDLQLMLRRWLTTVMENVQLCLVT